MYETINCKSLAACYCTKGSAVIRSLYSVHSKYNLLCSCYSMLIEFCILRLASMLSRQEITSCIVGLMLGLWFTHLQAASSTFNICSSYPVPRSAGSKTSIFFPWDLISCTHWTSSLDLYEIGTGRWPVSSSSSTTPKLYISPLRVATQP